MGYHLRRLSRAQADRELYGGSLKQKSFKGGMNLDAPASELKEDELALAENVICREFGTEARPGSIQYSQSSLFGLTPSLVYGYTYVPATFTGTYANYRHFFSYNGEIRTYPDSPASTYIAAGNSEYTGTTGTFAAGTGNCTLLPYRRGILSFTNSKIGYVEPAGAFQVNAPNPVHGPKTNTAAAANSVYRYLFTLSRIISYSQDPTSFTISDDRLAAGAEVVHETGTNGKRYSTSNVSTARDTDYGEINKAVAISTSSALVLPVEDLAAAFSGAGVTDNTAARHFTHISIYRTLDIAASDSTTGLGNSRDLYVWVGDMKRSTVMGLSTTFSDMLTDDALRNRIASGNFILKSRGFQPMPSGDCAEVTSAFIFVADRSNTVSENRVHYCGLSSPEFFGYYFPELQNQRFNDGIRAMRSSQDTLSIFCNNSSHVCALTSITQDVSKLQYIPILNYFQPIDKTLGIRDWGTLDSIDQNTMIAVCSDATVRIWDGTKWGEDISYGKVNSEIRQIVPASPYNYAQGSVGRYYNGAYELWYSKSSSDTYLTSHLRYGFGKSAGYGWTTNTNWVKPPFKTGAAVILDNTGAQRLIVMSAVTATPYTAGRLYWVNTFRPYTGATEQSVQMARVDVDGGRYEDSSIGTEITQKLRFREMTSSEESQYLVHQETHLYLRPLSEAAGYRTGNSVSLLAYKNGSTTAAETLTSVPKTADVAFTKEIASRRIQLEVQLITGASRFVGIDNHCRTLDRRNYATSGDVSSTESTTSYPQYQAELASNLKLWVTRRNFGLDRASGLNMAQTGTVAWAAGADGGAATGYTFTSGSFTKTASYTYGDFSVCFAIKSPTAHAAFLTVAGATPLVVKFDSNTSLVVSTLADWSPSDIGSAWNIFTLIRTGGIFTGYQNGVLMPGGDTYGDSLGGGNITVGFPSSTGSIFDLRLYSVALSAGAAAYYYSDIINNSGNCTLPMV